MLGSSLHYEQTLTDVARLAVPRIADWCAVDIFVGDRLERLALEHVDPLKVALARELQETMLAASAAAGAAAIRTRTPVLVREIDDEALATFGFDERQLEIARSLAPRSYVTVPLVARDKVFGTISLVTAESGRVYADDDRRSPRSSRGTPRPQSTMRASTPRRSAWAGRRGRSKPSATASSSSTAAA